MRNCILLLLSSVGFLASAQQSGFKGGVVIGGNMSIIKGADSKKLWAFCNEVQYLPGYSGGVYVSREFPKSRLTGRIEIKYTRGGTKCIYSYLGVPVIDKLILEYAELPVLIYFTFAGKREHKIYAGISIARLVGSTMKTENISSNPSIVWFPLKKTNFFLTLGYRFNIGDHFYAVLNFSASIGTVVPDYQVYTQALALNLNYEF